ncbi:TVG0890000 [Thermoplasma volcanium GSS1]|uniref:TVG0890000 protein n=1 Tax=Thermoplasma volcanium (strain ATCC 51530 / DSM 4299 / JCM 9571 / NBRC 15438 / GSS1) TaxID=273116 RepID=Q97AD9_THEVO|nr:hypothetical protein [Thermoplasma volcanium]BAB60013.1 TVG0890000 [Thermoplasma volcanium GSS1]
MSYRDRILFILLFYIVLIVLVDFLFPIFLPAYAGAFSYFPLIFFFPFFMFGRRYRGRQAPAPAEDESSDEKKDDYDYAYQYENYDEFGIRKRRRDSIIFYALGAAILIAAIAVVLLKFSF